MDWMTTKFAVLSDPHGNPPALRAVLEDIDRQGCDEIIVLGDILNGLDPSGTTALLMERQNIRAIRGNAEAYTFTPRLEEFPRRNEPMFVELIPLLRWFEAHLTPIQAAWLSGLPDFLVNDGDCFVHDSPIDRLDPAQWHLPGFSEEYQEILYHAPGISLEMAAEKWDALAQFCHQRGIRRVFCGHTHVPFVHLIDGVVVCNAGSAGFSLDGDPRVAWVLVEGEEVTVCRVPYDIEAILAIADRTPDFHDFDPPERKAAYRKMLQTGIHWREHLVQ
jgi:predicted phosphodiesterase